MKKILLASTILVGTTGFAAADVTFSGAAYIGLAYSTGVNEFEPANVNLDNDNLWGEGVIDLDGDLIFGEGNVALFTPEVTASFTAGMMTTTNGGLEAGASITVNAPGISMEDDHTDAAFGVPSTDASSISDATAYLSGTWGSFTATYDADGTNDGNDSIPPFTQLDPEADVTFTYAGTFSNFSVEAYYTWSGDWNDFDGAAGASNGDLGAMASYSFGDYSVYGEFDWDASAEGGAGDWRVGFGGSAMFSGFSLAADVDYTPADIIAGTAADWDWKVEAGYTTGAFTVGAFAEDDGADDQIDFGANGAYSLGGGVSITAAAIYDNDLNATLLKAGVEMSF